MKYYAVALFLGIATSAFGSPFFPGFYVVAAKGVNRPPEVVAEKHQVPGVKSGAGVANLDSSEVPVLLKDQVPKREKKVETSLLPAVGKFAKEVFEAVIAPFKGDETTLQKKRPENAEHKKKNIHEDIKKKANKAKPDTLFAIPKHDAGSLKLEEMKKAYAIGAENKPNSLLKQEEEMNFLNPKKPQCSTIRCKVPPKNMKCKTMKTRSEAASFADMFGIKEPVKDKWESCCPIWFCYNSGKPMFYRIIQPKNDPKVVPTRRPPWFFEKYNKHSDTIPKEVPADRRLNHELNRRPPILLSMVNPWRIQTCRADEDQRKPLLSSNAHHQVHHHHHDQEDSPNYQEIREVPSSSESSGFMDLVLNSLVPNPPGIFIELHPIHERGTQHKRDFNWHSDHHLDDEGSSGLRPKVLHLH